MNIRVIRWLSSGDKKQRRNWQRIRHRFWGSRESAQRIASVANFNFQSLLPRSKESNQDQHQLLRLHDTNCHNLAGHRISNWEFLTSRRSQTIGVQKTSGEHPFDSLFCCQTRLSRFALAERYDSPLVLNNHPPQRFNFRLFCFHLFWSLFQLTTNAKDTHHDRLQNWNSCPVVKCFFCLIQKVCCS